MQEAFEVLKGQLRQLENMANENKDEPELQFQITDAMVQIAEVMTRIAITVLRQ